MDSKPSWQGLARLGCFSLVLVWFPILTLAQDSETRKELWPEVDVFVPVKPKIRLMFLGTVTRLEETKDNTEASFGANIDFLLNKRFTLRAGYRYSFSLTGDDPYKEHRLIYEQTFKQPLPLEVLLSDRNREEIRFVNGDTSFRYRNRLTLEREFEIKKFSLTPYGYAEAFYDTRFDTWNRNRLAVGIQAPLKLGFPLLRQLDPKRVIVLDVYIQRQLDSRSQPSHVKGLGFTVNIYL